MADDIEDDLDWLIGDDDHDQGKESNEEHSNGDHSRDKNSDDEVPENNIETDDEDDGLTPAERDILERNTLLNDASDREDYDLKDKVEKANADLESLKALDSSRETRVMFKKKLVEVEAPPLDYSSDSSSSSSSDSDHSSKNEEQAAQNKKIAFDLEDKRDDGEDVLVEKGGRFEWMSDTTGSEPEDNYKSQSISSAKKEHPVRPRSAPIGKSKSQFQQPSPRERPSSASRSHEYSHIKSPYAMSPEMKELMRKRQAARAAREEEERAQERAREEQNRKNSEEAWKAWLERKDQEVMERKKKKQEEEEKKQLNYDPKQEADEAYQVWLKEKRKQRKKDRIEEQQRRLEVDEGWYRRDRKDCDLAYKRWLRQKQKESPSLKTTDKKHIQQSRADIYRMRQLQRLIMSIRTSQNR